MTLPHLLFAPLLPVWALVLAGLAGLCLVLWGWRSRVPAWARLVPLAALLLALANPRLSEEEATPLDDVAVVVVDESPSMLIGDRHAQAEQALAGVLQRLKKLPNLEVRVERWRNPPGRDEGTHLFAALDRALADLPRRRLAGVVMITDGQINDVPDHPDIGAPLHVLLAGHKDERDRRIVVEQSPSFGIVGGTAQLSFRVEDMGRSGEAEVTIRRDGGEASRMPVVLNTSTRLDLPISHAGPNIVELEAEAVPNELTLANNHAAVSISGVRDRLRVLLISGEPHAGERTWRNLLKADPAVDLVHFTILRPPEKDDRTPLRELALISFPVRELFEEKLHDFDLVIFDRYRRRSVLPPAYYQNLADYVKGGGALLMAAGPEFSSPDTPYDTALSEVLPTAPAGNDINGPFQPRVTDLGKRHPVTARLSASDPPAWGPWMRIIGNQPKDGVTTLMQGPDGQSLLLLNRVGEGRVAALMSDTIWLWSRGYDGGGPQAELLRRLAHWLMKEPELEEDQLTAEITGDHLSILHRSLEPGPVEVTLIAPDGSERKLTLADQGDGRATAGMTIDQQGLWRVGDGKRVALAAAGSINPVEMAELRSTPDKLKPVVDATGGAIRRITDGLPDMRRFQGQGATASGASWFGFRANNDRIVTALRDTPLIPGALLMLLAFGGLILAWWREGR